MSPAAAIAANAATRTPPRRRTATLASRPPVTAEAAAGPGARRRPDAMRVLKQCVVRSDTSRSRPATAPCRRPTGSAAALSRLRPSIRCCATVWPSVGVNCLPARNGHDNRCAPTRTAAKVGSRRLSPSSGRAAKGKPPMRPDTKRMDEPRNHEPSTVVVGYDGSEESRKALHHPSNAQGEVDAISPQRPGQGPTSSRRVRPPRREAQAELWASTRTSRALSSRIVGTFATGMSAAGMYTVRWGRTVGTYATGQATR
jgi:hypothetical protein